MARVGERGRRAFRVDGRSRAEKKAERLKEIRIPLLPTFEYRLSSVEEMGLGKLFDYVVVLGQRRNVAGCLVEFFGRKAGEFEYVDGLRSSGKVRNESERRVGHFGDCTIELGADVGAPEASSDNNVWPDVPLLVLSRELLFDPSVANHNP